MYGWIQCNICTVDGIEWESGLLTENAVFWSTPLHLAGLSFRSDWTRRTCTCRVWKLLPLRPSHRPPLDSNPHTTRSTSCVYAAMESCSWRPPRGYALLTTIVMCVGDETLWLCRNIVRRTVPHCTALWTSSCPSWPQFTSLWASHFCAAPDLLLLWTAWFPSLLLVKEGNNPVELPVSWEPTAASPPLLWAHYSFSLFSSAFQLLLPVSCERITTWLCPCWAQCSFSVSSTPIHNTRTAFVTFCCEHRAWFSPVPPNTLQPHPTEHGVYSSWILLKLNTVSLNSSWRPAPLTPQFVLTLFLNTVNYVPCENSGPLNPVPFELRACVCVCNSSECECVLCESRKQYRIVSSHEPVEPPSPPCGAVCCSEPRCFCGFVCYEATKCGLQYLYDLTVSWRTVQFYEAVLQGFLKHFELCPVWRFEIWKRRRWQ
jgi:hypothetical protein